MISADQNGYQYRGRDEAQKRDVHIVCSGSDNRAEKDLFLAEARLRSTLSHPQLASLYDYGFNTEGIAYCVQTLPRGQSILAVPPQRYSDMAYFTSVVSQILHVCAYLHSQGLALGYPSEHGILIESDQCSVLHCAPGRILRSSAVLLGQDYGTSDLLAPEVLTAGACDARADLYLLGCLLYRALTGRPVFAGQGRELAHRQLFHDITPVEEFNPSVPDLASRWILRLLARDREQRFQSARQALQYWRRYAMIEEPALSSLPAAPTLRRSAVQPVGAEAILGSVRQFLDNSSGKPLLEIAGERGTGKSMLMRQLYLELHLSGQPVLLVDNPSLASLAQSLETFRRTSEVSAQQSGINDRNELIYPLTVESLSRALLEEASAGSADRGPLVLFIDNSDQLPAETGELIQILCAKSGARLRIILAHTTQLRLMGATAVIKTLSKLTPAQVPLLCRAVLGDCELSQELMQALYTATSGNPCAISLALSKLERDGIIFQRDSLWLNLAAIPPSFGSLVDLMADLIDSLKPAAGLLLSPLAESKTALSGDELSETVGLGLWELIPGLNCLVQLGMLHHRNGRFYLSHDLLADALRRQTAKPLAAATEQADESPQTDRLFPSPNSDISRAETTIPEVDETVAREIDERIAQIEQETEPRTLIKNGQSMLTAYPQMNMRLQYRLYKSLAAAFAAIDDEENEWTALQNTTRSARHSGDVDLLQEALIVQTEAALGKGAFAVADSLAAELRDSLGNSDADPGMRATVTYLTALAARGLNRDQDFIAAAEVLPAALIGSGQLQRAAATERELGWYFHSRAKDHEEALRHYNRALSLFADLGDSPNEARTLGNKGILLVESRALSEARDCLQRARATFQAAGEQRGELTACEYLLHCLLQNRELEEAEILAERIQTLAQALDDPRSLERLENSRRRLKQLQQSGMLTEAASADRSQQSSEADADEERTPLAAESDTASLNREVATSAGPAIVDGADQSAAHEIILAGSSDAIVGLRKRVASAAGNDAAIVLTGEYGSGVLEVARAIHARSRRRERPFHVLHCADYSADELHTTAFGSSHEVSSAQLPASGLLAESQGGSLLLEALDFAAPRFQSLLAALMRRMTEQDGEGRLNVRLMASCTETPEVALRAGRLKRDLYYRLAIVRINIPSLAQRRDDLPLLTRYLVEKYNKHLGLSIRALAPELMAAIMRKDRWAGNVLELEQLIQSLMIDCESDVLDGEIADADTGVSSFAADAVAAELPPAAATADVSTIDQVQKDHILRVLQQTSGNKSRAARLLGIKRTTLLARMKKLGLMP